MNRIPALLTAAFALLAVTLLTTPTMSYASSELAADPSLVQNSELPPIESQADPFAGLETFQTVGVFHVSCALANEICADLEIGNHCHPTDTRCICISTLPGICALP
jgi:hypothetical protein